jgi:hypothetical protein
MPNPAAAHRRDGQQEFSSTHQAFATGLMAGAMSHSTTPHRIMSLPLSYSLGFGLESTSAEIMSTHD